MALIREGGGGVPLFSVEYGPCPTDVQRFAGSALQKSVACGAPRVTEKHLY